MSHAQVYNENIVLQIRITSIVNWLIISHPLKFLTNMREKILSRLKAKYSGVNLSKARMDAIADKLAAKITDENEIDAKLDELNDLMSFADIARQDDRVRTLEARVKPKPADKPLEADDEDDDQGGKKPVTKKQNDETPAWAKTLMDEVKSLKTEKVQSTMKTRLAEKLKDKVPATFYSKMTLPEKEEDFDQFVTQVESGWNEVKQGLINEGLMTVEKPAGGNGEVKASGKEDAEIKAWAEQNKPKSTEVKK
jgi:dsRNA-specific ribonuclease